MCIRRNTASASVTRPSKEVPTHWHIQTVLTVPAIRLPSETPTMCPIRVSGFRKFSGLQCRISEWVRSITNSLSSTARRTIMTATAETPATTTHSSSMYGEHTNEPPDEEHHLFNATFEIFGD